MKGEKKNTEAGGHKVKTVNSGANPDAFVHPVSIPQEIEKGSLTGEALEGFFSFGSRGKSR